MRPIAYVYDASEHCEDCAIARFGRCTAHNQIACCVEDSEGNEPGAIFSYETSNYDSDIVCDDCGAVLYSHADQWWNGRTFIGELPEDCILDCSAPGQPADDSVKYWIERLSFAAPVDETRDYLKEFGAWDSEQLADHTANVRRLLWSMCCDLRQDRDNTPYLGV